MRSAYTRRKPREWDGISMSGQVVDARRHAEWLLARGGKPNKALLARIEAEMPASDEEIERVLPGALKRSVK